MEDVAVYLSGVPTGNRRRDVESCDTDVTEQSTLSSIPDSMFNALVLSSTVYSSTPLNLFLLQLTYSLHAAYV